MAGSHRMDEMAKIDLFISRITDACRTSPAVKADLRSGIGKPVAQARRMHKTVLNSAFPSGQPPSKEQAYYTVAALIAAQPGGAFRTAAEDSSDDESSDGTRDIPGGPTADSAAASASEAAVGTTTPGSTSTALPPLGSERRNLGASLAVAVHQKKMRPNTAEARLHLLTRQATDGVHQRLPGVVRHLLAGSPLVPVDWAYLLYDLRRWEFERDDVAKEWLQTYYRTLHRAEEAQKAKRAQEEQASSTESSSKTDRDDESEPR
jgi:CRISPR system Cascade subunit CasB